MLLDGYSPEPQELQINLDNHEDHSGQDSLEMEDMTHQVLLPLILDIPLHRREKHIKSHRRHKVGLQDSGVVWQAELRSDMV